MPVQSEYLKMTIPLSGEFTDTWDGPLNENLVIIDSYAKNQSNEILAARGNKASLNEFLAVSHNNDGTLKPTAEVEDARNSPVYGHKGENSAYALADRLAPSDWEIWKAREQQANLKAALALREFQDPYMIVSGGANADGEPTWGTFSNLQININANPTIELLINGFRCHIRVPSPINNLVSLDVAANTNPKYVVAQYQDDGIVIVDGDTTDDSPSSPAAATGIISQDTSGEDTIFYDANTDFVDSGVQIGDILRVVSGDSAGDYIIQEVGPEEYDGDPEQNKRIKIKGLFPVGSLSGLDYQVRDPLGVLLTVEETIPEDADKLIIMDVTMLSASEIATVYERHFKNVYIGPWRQISDITSEDIDPDSESSGLWYHRLLSDKLEVSIQASTANDGTAPVEQLSVLNFVNTLGVSIDDQKDIDLDSLGLDLTGLGAGNGDLAVGVGSLGTALAGGPTDPQHTHGVTGSPALTGSVELTGSADLSGKESVSLTGTITAALTGNIYPANAVKVQWDRRKIRVKNTISGVFFKDLDGTTHTAGYIRVIVRKRG